MAAVVDSEMTISGAVAELRRQAPDVAKLREAWWRFDAVAGVAPLPDEALAKIAEHRPGRRRFDPHRTGLWFSFDVDGWGVWWTDSYVAVRRDGARDWQVPPARNVDGETLTLPEWLPAKQLAVTRKAGVPDVLAVDAIGDALERVRVLRDACPPSGGDDETATLGSLVELRSACEATAPNIGNILSGAVGRDGNVPLRRVRLQPGAGGNRKHDVLWLQDGDHGFTVPVNPALLALFPADSELVGCDDCKPIMVQHGGRMVGLVMPMRNFALSDRALWLREAAADLAASPVWKLSTVTAKMSDGAWQALNAVTVAVAS